HGVADDVADARIAAGDPLLEELDGEGKRGADDDGVERADAREGEAGAEGDEEQEVLDELGEGGFAGKEVERPALRELRAGDVECGEQDDEGREGHSGPGETAL